MEIRRKTARGMTMVEVLIVLGIAAVAIAGVIGMVDAARTTMIGDNNARAIHNFDAALNRFKTVRRACGGDVPTASFDPIGDEVTATAGVTSPPNPTAGDAEERCENHIWETFTSAISDLTTRLVPKVLLPMTKMETRNGLLLVVAKTLSKWDGCFGQRMLTPSTTS